MSIIFRVAVPSILRQTFDYLVLTSSASCPQPGIRVKIPFGHRQLVGIVLAVVDITQAQVPIKKLKPVLTIIDSEPILSDRLLTLNRWVAEYYHHPIGEVMTSSLPKSLRQGQNLIVDKKPNLPSLASIAACSQSTALTLTKAQSHAVTEILKTQQFQPFLLEGVTGSGKTEVYLRVIAEKLQQNKQALILVPEISLTSQTIARFTHRFRVPMSVLHSQLTDKDRLKAWCDAYNGKSRIVIGTRSALFTPLPDLGVIILDESHDPSFKQQSGLRYSARDVAIKRAQLENIPVILGSATPSLESLHNVTKRKLTHLSLPERAGGAIHPTFHLIDLRMQKLEKGISSALFRAIRKHLDNKGQILLFLNRRGFAPVLLCHHCGWSATCQRCTARYTLHQQPWRLICHHCGSMQEAPEECPQCHTKSLLQCGSGTQRLEKVLTERFPNVPLVRIDKDTTRKRGTLDKMLEAIQRGDARLLLGTQMLSKGHHFPDVTMVGIVDGDGGLYSTDFRATERLAQLIVQVAGRAGRATKSGEVYIQTHAPEHPLLQCLLNQGYLAFAQTLLRERRQARLPPFHYLVMLRAEAMVEQFPLQFLQQAREISVKFAYDKIDLLGPVPALMPRRAGKFRAQLLIRSSNRQALYAWLSKTVPTLETLRLARKVRWSIDVDPQEM